MGDRRIQSDDPYERDDECAGEGDLRSELLRIDEPLRRLDSAHHHETYGDERSGQSETENDDQRQPLSDISDRSRGKENGECCGAGNDSAGNPEQYETQRPQLLVRGRLVMVMAMIVGMGVTIMSVAVALAMVVVLVLVVAMVMAVAGVISMVMMVAVTVVMVTAEEMEVVMSVSPAGPAHDDHPDAYPEDDQAGHYSQVPMQLLVGEVAR